MFELLIDILPVILLITMGNSFWFGRKKGYSGIILALISFIFPVMAIIVFFLPDRNEMKRNAEEYRIRAGQESLELRAKQEVERMSILDLRAIAIEHANNGNEERALSFFETAAKRGDMKSQHVCGIWYEEGRGCTVDYEKSLYWYKQAAEQGFIKSQLYCAELYAGKLHDQENALYWYRKAAEQGDADAQRILGQYAPDEQLKAVQKEDKHTPEEVEDEDKIEAIMAAWRASKSYKEDLEHFGRVMDEIKREDLK